MLKDAADHECCLRDQIETAIPLIKSEHENFLIEMSVMNIFYFLRMSLNVSCQSHKFR